MWDLYLERRNNASAEINYLDDIVTDDEIYDTEIRRHIGIAKYTFQKLSKVVRDMKISLETKKTLVSCNIKSRIWK